MDMTCSVLSALWWLLLTEIRSKFYVIEYIVVFLLNDFLVRNNLVLTPSNCNGLISVKLGANFICCIFHDNKGYKAFP